MADLLLEVGCEEIPAGMIEEALAAFERVVRWHLAEANVPHGRLEVFSTPRRLAVRVADLPDRTPEKTERMKGPPERVAFGADGAPTRAAEGFARKAGVDVAALERADGYVWATARTPGRPVRDSLAEALPKAVGAIPWPKSMRWEGSGVRFVRPIRWLVCLLGGRVLPVEVAGVRAGAVSRGRRFVGRGRPLAGPRLPIPSPRRYPALLERSGVVVDRDRRIGRVARLLAEAAEAEGAELDFAAPTLEAIETLADLVEEPVVVPVEFDRSHLDLPPEILRVVLWHHQKYVGLRGRDGRPVARFLAVRNAGPKEPGAAIVAAGNRRVVAARLADARHFFHEDRRLPLEAYRERLKTIVFHERAGTVFDRTERIGRLAARIVSGQPIGARTGEAARADRAGRLSKADLVTQTVYEFPELQGVVGRIYAALDGEMPEVAQAIEDHYKPAGASGDLPRPDSIGQAVALAERFDLLAALFAAGERPGAAADPFGMRRAAIGILRILLRDDGTRWHLPLRATVEAALEAVASQGVRFDAPAVADEIVSFLRGRLVGLLVERGLRRDLVEAVLAADADSPVEAVLRAEAVEAWRRRPDFEAITVSFRRAANILEGEEGRGTVREDLFEGEAERDLLAAVRRLEQDARVLGKRRDYAALLERFASVRPVVDRFFDDVLVNCDDPAKRENRKALLGRLAAVFGRVIDFSKVQAARP